ncbi:MAG: DUF2513 domain-containing protein [Ruminococcus sp.]|nr:DUF2513 domain-containing protein [Ruminococcus sp.]
MKLNPDCIRDILFEIEDITTFDTCFDYFHDSPPESGLLSKYEPDEIVYHIRQCNLYGLLYKTDWDMQGNVSVQDLSPSGHDFIANVRSDSIWNDVKTVSTKVGSKSVNALTQIATGVVTALIKSQLGIN